MQRTVTICKRSAPKPFVTEERKKYLKVQRTKTICKRSAPSPHKLNQMPNTYTQLYIQLVFAVKGRRNLIPKEHKAHVHRYITGVVQERTHKLIAINSMPDHIHIFVGLKPVQSISDLVNNIKTASTKFIKKQEWMQADFSWQNGFGAFSYSQSHIDNVYKYIQNQEEHHRKKTFQEEYIQFLEKFEIPYKEEYLFEFYE